MRVDVFFTPAELEKCDRKEKVVVVIDALRATSTMIKAFENGCQAFIPVRTVEEAKERVAGDSSGFYCLGGERGGRKLEGFQFGNSPRDYRPEEVFGKTVVMTTTNGTRTLVAAQGAAKVFIGAFLNRRALARRLAEEKRDVIIACAGEKEHFCLEDALCAGSIIETLEKLDVSLSLSDSAIAARFLYQSSKDSLCQRLLECEWGKYLESIGQGPDVEICAQLDSSAIVPVYEGGKIFLDR